MRIVLSVVVALVAMASACAPAPTETGDQASGTCADGSAPLSVTGLCQDSVAAQIPAARLEIAQTLEGPAAQCAWTFQDVAIGDGSEAILFRAMRCGDVTTTFEHAGGAHSASLNYQASALGAEQGREAARIFVSDPQDPNQVIRNLISELPAAERAKCEVHAANVAGWPTDALVIGYNTQAARTLPANEPNAVCGDYGLDEDAMKYWLVRDGYAYFFNLGQDGLDFDPNSFTLFRRGADGAWAPAS